MSTVLSDIKSTNWQISTAGFGVIAEGLEDIRQCLDILLRTSRGSDPFRPEFGSDIFQFVDTPVNVAAPNIKRSIIEAVEIWEKRVTILSIKDYLENSTLYFNITYRLANQDIIDSLLLSADGLPTGYIQQGYLILQAFYPVNPNGKPYYLRLVFDDEQAKPLPPAEGFNTINGMFEWALQNLNYAGRWVQLVDRFVLYVAPGYATTASIAIELLAGVINISALLPLLAVGQTYLVEFSVPAGVGVPGTLTMEIDTQAATKDGLQIYMQQNYSQYGSWKVLPGNKDLLGDFSAVDYSSDFNTATTKGYYLVLNSSVLTAGALNVRAK